jgi:hypothetical protein
MDMAGLRCFQDRPNTLSVGRARCQAWHLGRVGVWLGMLVGVLGAGQSPPQPPPQTFATTTPAPSPATSPMDAPLRVLAEARESYRGVRDYACVFIKKERLRGQLQPDNLIAMKVRTQPFSIYLHWHGPKQFAGQEVCYVTGRNNGMMRVHSTGLVGAVGFVTLDPRDPRAMENSRHSITEAGIGNLLDRFSRGWEMERQLNRTQVRVADYEYNKRRCVRVETTHPDNAAGRLNYYRSIVYFDKEIRLPIRVENYDWPRPGGDPNGDLLESYSYVDLRLNVGLSEETFNH